MKKKKICIITGSRSEWGLFYPLARQIKKENGFVLNIIATGAHLSKEYGFTYREIVDDGFKVDYKLNTLFPGDSPESILNSIVLEIQKLIKPLKTLNPDLVFLLGDRFETFAAALTGFFLKIPIAHIHGGERTEGSLDDSLRHAITKIAYLHFTSTEVYRKRIIQMGEEPDRVFTVGALGLDNVRNDNFLNKAAFEERIGFKLGQKNILVTFNPPTLEEEANIRGQIFNLFKVIDDIQGLKVIFTQTNPDIYATKVSGLIKRYVQGNRDKAILLVSLGRRLYLSALKFVDAVAGNSSSGIIEAPSFKIPTINIGSRQSGRVKAASLLDCEGSYNSIKNAFKRAFSESFRAQCRKTKNPYGDGHSAERIVNIVKKEINALRNPKKSFYDISCKNV